MLKRLAAFLIAFCFILAFPLVARADMVHPGPQMIYGLALIIIVCLVAIIVGVTVVLIRVFGKHKK